jgi:hypothetical protein
MPQYNTSEEYLSNADILKNYIDDKSVMVINAKIQ